MTLFLVRHGLPLQDGSLIPARWELDPAGFDTVWALRESGLLPQDAAWFCSPEPSAIGTAQLLTEGQVGIVEDLGEHRRVTTDRIPDLAARVREAFAHPDTSAYDGWEPLSACRDRVVPAVRRILDVHAGEDVVLVGHATAWTLTIAALSETEPDLERWAALSTPDVLLVTADMLGP